MVLIERVNHLGRCCLHSAFVSTSSPRDYVPGLPFLPLLGCWWFIVARGTVSPCCNRGPLLGRRKRNTAVSLRSSWAGLLFLREITGESGGWKKEGRRNYLMSWNARPSRRGF